MKINKLSFKNFNIIFTVFAAIYIVISIINMVITAKINRLFDSFLSAGSSLLRGFSLKGTSVKDMMKSSLQLTGGSNVDPSLRPSGIYSFIIFVLLISFIVFIALYLKKIFETNKNHKILNDLNIVLLLVSLFLTVLYTYKVDYINNTNTFFVGIVFSISILFILTLYIMIFPNRC